nr:hypothetical protein [Tanacetum cinerariifolium]
MQEFWAIDIVHHHSIHFKMNNKKRIVNLEYFREMLHICPRIPNHPFDELPFKEEILAFLRNLGHNGEIKKITDVNINKLHQTWGSFVAVINKCLSDQQVALDEALVPHASRLRIGKEEILAFLRELGHSGEIKMITDSPFISSSNPLGMYHKKNVDFAYLLWEDFVYQVEHKDAKKSNEMYYPRFTKVIVNFFMTKDQSIPRRNKVNWHFAMDDHMFTPIKLVSRHQNTQQYGAILPIELTNDAIRNFESYKEYYAIASGAAPPKIKASVRKTQSSSDTTMPPPVAKGTRLRTSAKVDKPAKGKQPAKSSTAKGLTVLSKVALTNAEQMKLATKRSLLQTHISQASGSGVDEGTSLIPGVPDVPPYESDEYISWKSSDEDDDDDVQQSKHDKDIDDQSDDESYTDQEDDDDQDDNDDDQTDSDDDGNDNASHDMNVRGDEGPDAEDDDNELYRDLNFNLEGIDSLFESTPWVDVLVTTTFEPLLLTAPTFPPPSIPIISQAQQAPAPSLATAPSTSLQELLNFGSLFGFDHRLKTLEANFSEFMQTNQFAESVSSILDEAQSKNEDFLNKLDENIQKIIKEEVKEQVKVQVSKIVPKIEKTINEQLEAEVLTRTSNSSKTSYDVVDDLSELELKKILIEKMESNKVQISSKDCKQICTAEEPMQTTQDLEEPAHLEFETGFLMNRLKVDTLTPELLVGPTYELMKGSCKRRQYPHDLLKPLPLIPNSRGRRVIPFDHFIYNELEYLRGGASSQKYTTSITKTKVADYGHIKWIKDLVPRTMWSQVPVSYDKYALWGISHWGRKRKLTNLTVEERFDFNVSLRMFTRSIVIQRRVEDLQLGVKSYQKNLNLTMPDTYISDLKRKEAYTAYSNPRGFIYQNKDKQNRLIRIDELHKFNDGTLNDV